jgi:hypothetical protein
LHVINDSVKTSFIPIMIVKTIYIITNMIVITKKGAYYHGI